MIDTILAFIQQHRDWAWAFALIIAFAESLIIVGFFVPGWILLLALGGLIGAQLVPFFPVFVAAYIGAVLGEGLGFSLGFAHSEKIRQSRWLQQHQEAVLQAENLFLRYGALSLIVGRFVGPVRAILPFVAGFLNYSRARYWLLNTVTGFFWAAAYLLPGIFSGAAVHFSVQEMAPVFIHLAAIVACFYLGWHFKSHKRVRTTFWLVGLFTIALFPWMPWFDITQQWLANTTSIILR